jgi:hypothetical protein
MIFVIFFTNYLLLNNHKKYSKNEDYILQHIAFLFNAKNQTLIKITSLNFNKY